MTWELLADECGYRFQMGDNCIALVVHELATNYLKYGALSVTSAVLTAWLGGARHPMTYP
ncbi:hypothetical protein ABIE49_001130 [Bradyrhizobium sp. OAE829]